MQHPILRKITGLIATAAVALALVGCRGPAGQDGANGTNGSNGSNGSNGGIGPAGPSFALDASTFTKEQWGELTLKGTITGVTMGTTPIVNFKVTDGNNTPLKGLGFNGKGSTDAFQVYLNMGFSVAKLIPADPATGAPSRWVNYIVTANPTAAAPSTWNPGRPSTDSIGTLVDNGDGSYRYTFRRDISLAKAQLDAYTYTGNNVKADLDDVTYDPTKVHRITAYVGGTAWGTGSNNATRTATGVPSVVAKFPANFFYDFIPATGALVTSANEQREITSTDKCFSCHSKFEFHGEGRQDTRYCVICHNGQRKYGYANATLPLDPVAGQRKYQDQAMGDFPSFIHRLHAGEELKVQGWSYAGVRYNEITYPQDHRNCVKCHTNSAATPQGDNWFKKPSRLACGGCHDNIVWATGAGHGPANEGGPQLSDQNCVNCHKEADIKTYHVPVAPPNTQSAWHVAGGSSNTNAGWIAAFPNNLPAGASRVTWEIKSLTLNSSAKPVIVFRFVKDGQAVVFNDPATKTEMMDNFIGGPSVYVAWTVPYDGITTPADWNATTSTYLKNIWRGDGKDQGGRAIQPANAATLAAGTGADAGWYVLTFTGVVIPNTASMITAGIGYTYGLGSATPNPPTLPWTDTQPLTQTNVPGFPLSQSPTNPKGKIGGLLVPAPNATKALTGALPAGWPAPNPATSSVPYATGPAHETRRAMVTNQKCNDCHGALGVFTAKSYHAGQRNDAPTCEFCHNGQRVNSGWGVNTKDFVHALHGAGKRVNKYSWEATAGAKYWNITYPSVLNNCEICHVPGSYDFGNTTNAGEVPNLNWTTVASGNYKSPNDNGRTAIVVITGNEVIDSKDTVVSPFVQLNNDYGANFSYNAGTGATTQAATTTLVNSPYVAACSNCHDSVMAINHMKANGGSFYASRGSVQANPAAPVAGAPLVNKEQCFLCHSAGKIADVQKVHMEFR
ncbi:MAG: OmcA/MtrC family decaheme c-type cytochrome [Acidobacteria bacterium]|nr:OmcA/MtrC family decaheme c-type cytochrome [Acidobacteriota bacterium]